MIIQLSGLHIYPVKSLGGIAVDTAQVEARGLAGDRRWMVVAPDGRFLSQRSQPRLALVQVASAGIECPGGWILSAPDREPILLHSDLCGPRREVEVWQSRLAAAAAPAAADRWLSDFLDTPCRLVHQPEEVSRAVTSSAGLPGEEVSFADGFPYLLTCEASLAELNGRLDSPVTMARFRPNLVVAGSLPFAEDEWSGLQIGEVSFRVAKACPRCQVINVDPRTGRRGREPLATLASYRQRDEGVCFGLNLVACGDGRLGLGDEVLIQAISY